MTSGTPVLDRLRNAFGTMGAGVYAAALSLLTLSAVGLIGLLTHMPWLFPSLGPTLMLFFESPDQPSSRPLNTLVGHGVGLAAGIACFYAFGIDGLQAAPVGGLTAAHVLAGAVSVAATTLALTMLRLPHPPAGATTLIVSLGILHTPVHFLTMAAAVVAMTALAWGANILLGTKPAAQ
ncbi:HPP family protein [uncultured Arthrobacter sp.]|uniref:HPP family protein n=1 Tax=uncultured Arthrobacter sp. TaxID=114050 RepID=UPI00261F13F2|nr:HPP family protein [uncultured Arthrobacter sp.]